MLLLTFVSNSPMNLLAWRVITANLEKQGQTIKAWNITIWPVIYDIPSYKTWNGGMNISIFVASTCIKLINSPNVLVFLSLVANRNDLLQTAIETAMRVWYPDRFTEWKYSFYNISFNVIAANNNTESQYPFVEYAQYDSVSSINFNIELNKIGNVNCKHVLNAFINPAFINRLPIVVCVVFYYTPWIIPCFFIIK